MIRARQKWTKKKRKRCRARGKECNVQWSDSQYSWAELGALLAMHCFRYLIYRLFVTESGSDEPRLVYTGRQTDISFSLAGILSADWDLSDIACPAMRPTGGTSRPAGRYRVRRGRPSTARPARRSALTYLSSVVLVGHRLHSHTDDLDQITTRFETRSSARLEPIDSEFSTEFRAVCESLSCCCIVLWRRAGVVSWMTIFSTVGRHAYLFHLFYTLSSERTSERPCKLLYTPVSRWINYSAICVDDERLSAAWSQRSQWQLDFIRRNKI